MTGFVEVSQNEMMAVDGGEDPYVSVGNGIGMISDYIARTQEIGAAWQALGEWQKQQAIDSRCTGPVIMEARKPKRGRNGYLPSDPSKWIYE